MNSINIFSQIKFEKGYFINNSDQKTECFIRNVDWANCPQEFDYKLTPESEKKTATILEVKEFGVYENSKFIRKTIDIDRSSEYHLKMSTIREPIFKKETIFLKVIVEGVASLFIYSDTEIKRYFYKTETVEINQLIHKRYIIEGMGKTGKNNRFRQQLWNDLKCEAISEKMVERVEYYNDDLSKLFETYNNCKNATYINYNKLQKFDYLNLSIKAGLNYSSLKVEGLNKNFDIDFGSKVGFRIGVEAEFNLPFNKNKWAFVTEPTFQYYNNSKEHFLYPGINSEISTFTINYKSIEIPLGIRYFLYLNDNSKIFVNAFFVYDFNFNSKITAYFNEELDISISNNFAIGVGYKKNNKYSLEGRLYTQRNLTHNYQNFASNYNSISLVFGYSFL